MNVVFDLCGVVFAWKPEAILANAPVPPELHARVKVGFFTHADWLDLDRGTLPRSEAIRRSAAYTGLSEATVAAMLPLIPLSLVVMPEMVNLLYRLKADHHRLFYLSNMNADCIEHIERNHAFWSVFEGGIASCRVQLLKPEPAIYTTLLHTFGLDAAKTIFFDDTPINLNPARQCGIRAVHFKTAGQCQKMLKTLGLLS